MTDLNNLIIFEMANNHQGDVNHGLKIIRELGRIAKKYKIKAAVKLQYRNLDTFIHPDYISGEDNKHISRFLSTKLSFDEFSILIKATKEEGMLSMVTPFDEQSVKEIIKHEVDIIKVASCSSDDWSLLEEIANTNLPTVISTGGCSVCDIDKLFFFFSHKSVNFAIMHCVALYPLENEKICMNFIDKLKKRYPAINIGWSGHESPDNYFPSQIALAKGATIFERHVGLETEKYKLNAYSSSPEHVENWVKRILKAKEICGENETKTISEEEIESLLSLKRGCYANKTISKNKKISSDDIFYAMPCFAQQLTSSSFSCKYNDFSAKREFAPYAAILNDDVENTKNINIENLREIAHQVIGCINENNITIPIDSELEISHHYGLEHFYSFGASIINIINRDYCKKIIVLLPGQKNPTHLHHIKEESFLVLSGELELSLNDRRYVLKRGEMITIRPENKHSFSSRDGCIFEEISSTHNRTDSYYDDPKISLLDPLERKTIIKQFKFQ